MDLAKPGEIKKHCEPNALSTFKEYLLDYASPQTRSVGEALIDRLLAELPAKSAEIAKVMLSKICDNKRDVFV